MVPLVRSSTTYMPGRTRAVRRIWGVTLVLTIALFIGGIVNLVVAVGDTGAADAYGSVPIPGARVVHLPKGSVDVAYREFSPYRLINGLPIPRIGLAVTAAGGHGPDPTLNKSFGGAVDNKGDKHARVFRLSVPREGDYRVQASGARGRDGAKFLFGHPSNVVARIAAPFVAMVLIWLLAGIAAFVLGRRARGDEPPTGATTVPPGGEVSFGGVRVIDASGGARGGITVSGGGSVSERLRKLDELHDQKLVSDEEYAAERKRVLDSI